MTGSSATLRSFSGSARPALVPTRARHRSGRPAGWRAIHGRRGVRIGDVPNANCWKPPRQVEAGTGVASAGCRRQRVGAGVPGARHRAPRRPQPSRANVLAPHIDVGATGAGWPDPTPTGMKPWARVFAPAFPASVSSASGALIPVLPYLDRSAGRLLLSRWPPDWLESPCWQRESSSGLLSGGPPVRQALRQLLIGYGAATSPICWVAFRHGAAAAPQEHPAVVHYRVGTIITGTGACRRIFEAAEPRNT